MIQEETYIGETWRTRGAGQREAVVGLDKDEQSREVEGLCGSGGLPRGAPGGR